MSALRIISVISFASKTPVRVSIESHGQGVWGSIVQLRGPPPVFWIVRIWSHGSSPPWRAEKLNCDGDRSMIGRPIMFNVTSTV